VVSVKHDGRIVESMTIRQGDQTSVIEADQYITSMPLAQLAFRLDPPPPQAVVDAASSLNYRDFLIVVLIIDQENLFPDNWLYIHDPEVKVGRIQNFKNWSEEMVPNLAQTSLGLEYFCSVGDETWEMSDDALMQLAAREIDQLGLANADWVTDGTVIRQRKAYPVYDENYRRHVQTIADCLDGFVNLQTIGRNGMHRYNNQDHSMLTGILAARNILGERHDLWEVNIERSYYEEVLVSSEKSILPSTTPIVRQSLECISRR
jgi:protoporphyrinogen oxidase